MMINLVYTALVVIEVDLLVITLVVGSLRRFIR